MFNDDRSDFAAPIAVFLYIALVSILTLVFTICVDSVIPENGITTIRYVCIVGLVIAAYNLIKGYLAEGFTAALYAFFGYAFIDLYDSFPEAIALFLLFEFCAVVCYKTGILDLAIINGVTGIIAMLALSLYINPAITALFCVLSFIPAVVALYVAYCDWTFAQEIIESYEDEFLGCDCDDDECDCKECSSEHPEGCTCSECTSDDAPAEKADDEPAEDASAAAEEEKKEE